MNLQTKEALSMAMNFLSFHGDQASKAVYAACKEALDKEEQECLEMYADALANNPDKKICLTKNDLTMRDYFAATALTGLLANYEIIKYQERIAKKNGTEYLADKPNWFPDSAYAFADEMLKARDR